MEGEIEPTTGRCSPFTTFVSSFSLCSVNNEKPQGGGGVGDGDYYFHRGFRRRDLR